MSLNLQPFECVKLYADLLRKNIRLLTRGAELANKSLIALRREVKAAV